MNKPGISGWWPLPGLPALTIFLSAGLIFQLELLLGKYLTPWFGGAPAVWLTCLMFYQVLLVAGYAYADGLQRLHLRRQVRIHSALVFGAVLFTALLAWRWHGPLLPGEGWKPAAGAAPIAALTWLLLASTGAQFFVLSATSSLLQAWLARGQGQSPYHLYALSNAGSLAGLVSYPFLVEPYLTLRTQALAWSGLFALFAGLMIFSGRRLARAGNAQLPGGADSSTAGRPRRGLVLYWMALAFCASLALLAVTSQMTQDIPPVPFLWMLPLAIYLASFIVGFAKRFAPALDDLLILLICALVFALILAARLDAWRITYQVAGYCFILAGICFYCHRALYLARPDARHLTGFYLAVAGGGAAGGLFANLAAPALFRGYWEYPLALALATVLACLGLFLRRDSWLARARWVMPALALGYAVLLVQPIASGEKEIVHTGRNFFGVLQIQSHVHAESVDNVRENTLLQGRIAQGMQYDRGLRRFKPTTYYTPDSGVGLAIRIHPRYIGRQPMRVGMVGLGIGTLAAYGRSNDVYRFFEINPDVIQVARHSPYFTFLQDSSARIEIILGDARLSLARENILEPTNRYDVLVIDAFNSDRIPQHLLTLEAFQLYAERLKPDGVLAVHITNRHLDLRPVVAAAIQELNWNGTLFLQYGDLRFSLDNSWILAARQPAAFTRLYNARRMVDGACPRPWTDDYSSLAAILK